MSNKLFSCELHELTPEERAEMEKRNKETFKSSYMVYFTAKKLNKNLGHGKINAFVNADMLNPKVVSNRYEFNSNYLKKNQAVLSKSKTGITSYQYFHCGMWRKKKGRGASCDY